MNGNAKPTQAGAGSAPDPSPGDEASPQPFRAVLTPHRSLSPRGFLALMIGLGILSFVTGMIFVAAGAWPVLGFFGLDALIVYVAFRLSYRSGRGYETLDLTPDRLVLTRVHPSGRQEQHECNPYWARVNLREWPNGRTGLSIVSRGTELVFGSFLTDEERRDLASALRAALLEARGGIRI